jgi:hypothetical protein
MLSDLPKKKSRVPISCSAQSSMADLIAIDLVQASMLARVRKTCSARLHSRRASASLVRSGRVR